MSDGNKLSILLLEENAFEKETSQRVKALLETTTNFDYELTSVSRFSELDEIDSHHIDILLLELRMPDARLKDALQSISTWSPDVPIIVISDDDLDSDDSILLGELAVHDYLLSSDLNVAMLRRCIRRTIHRCKRERDLFKNELSLRNTINNMGMGIVHVNFNGDIIETYHSFEHILGYSVEELKKINFQLLLYPPDADFDEVKWQAVRDGSLKHHRVEKRFIHKEGHVIWLEMNIALQETMIEWDDHYLIVVQDITQRKYVEQALELSNERFRLTLKNSPTMVFNQDRDLRITWMYNPIGQGSDIIGKNDYELIDNQEDAEILASLKREVMESGRGKRQEVRIRNSGMTSYFDLTVEPLYDVDGEILGVTCVVINITDRKRIEQQERQQRILAEALRDSAIVLNSTLDLSTVLKHILDNLHRVVEHDTADVVLYHNNTFEIMQSRGYSLDIVRRQFQTLEVPVDGFPLLKQAIELNAPIVIDDVTLTKDWIVMSQNAQLRSYLIMPIRQQQRLIGFINLGSNQVGYFHTAHVERLQAFAEHAALAIQNAQLFEKGQELATMQERSRLARELHDSVSQTLFTASIIAESLPRLMDRNPEKVKEMLQELYYLNRGALAETRILIDEFRPDKRNVSLVDQLRNLSSALRGRKQLEVEFKVHVSITPPLETKIALFRIAQEVFANIIRHSQAQHVSIALKDMEDQTLLEIKDDGIGFDIDAVRWGKGIKTIQEYAAEINANLQIESNPEKGTTVRVMLPTAN